MSTCYGTEVQDDHRGLFDRIPRSRFGLSGLYRDDIPTQADAIADALERARMPSGCLTNNRSCRTELKVPWCTDAFTSEKLRIWNQLQLHLGFIRPILHLRSMTACR